MLDAFEPAPSAIIPVWHDYFASPLIAHSRPYGLSIMVFAIVLPTKGHMAEWGGAVECAVPGRADGATDRVDRVDWLDGAEV